MIALLTDFGLSDPYVGVMKGVIASIAPSVPVFDVTHGVPPQDVVVGALFLDAAWRYFPVGTVFVCVVDPGVGTRRRPIAVASGDRLFIGPDNGLFSLLPDPVVRGIDHGPLPSRTFHGRDLFAPVAARLAARLVGFPDLGPVVTDPVRIVLPAPDGPRGEVLYCDGYGNAITNLSGLDDGTVEVAGRTLPIVTSYGMAAPGEAVALTGSTNRLEIAVRDGSAAATLGIGRGTPVRILTMKRG